MPVPALLTPAAAAAPISWFVPCGWADAFDAQSDEGKKILENAEEAHRHWSERAEALVSHYNQADAYQHVPPNRQFYVRTRYVYAGKGVPQPFDLDDE
jgi:hypothetical protein